MEDYKGVSTDLENLVSYFPKFSCGSTGEEDKSEKQNKNMWKLLSAFDVWIKRLFKTLLLQYIKKL